VPPGRPRGSPRFGEDLGVYVMVKPRPSAKKVQQIVRLPHCLASDASLFGLPVLTRAYSDSASSDSPPSSGSRLAHPAEAVR